VKLNEDINGFTHLLKHKFLHREWVTIKVFDVCNIYSCEKVDFTFHFSSFPKNLASITRLTSREHKSNLYSILSYFHSFFIPKKRLSFQDQTNNFITNHLFFNSFKCNISISIQPNFLILLFQTWLFLS